MPSPTQQLENLLGQGHMMPRIQTADRAESVAAALDPKGELSFSMRLGYWRPIAFTSV